MFSIAKHIILLTALFSILLPTPKATALDFEKMNLYQFSKIVSEKMGYTILFSPRVKTNRPIEVLIGDNFDQNKLYELFLTVVRMQGYAAVKSKNLVRVVRNRKARSMSPFNQANQ